MAKPDLVPAAPRATNSTATKPRELPNTAAQIPPRETMWNLTLVLETLIGEPYEPLKRASFKFLTHKCAFLLALASAKRVSELQALSGKIAHKEDWSMVSFDLAKDFLAKNEFPSST